MPKPKSSKLRPEEIRNGVQALYNLLKFLTDEKALAGIVLTSSAFDEVRDLFGPEAKPYNPSGLLAADPRMKDIFVIDELLIMRGTQLQ
jgi:hypothetical protein